MNRPWKIGEANHSPPRRSTPNSTDTGTRLGPTQPENLFHNSPSDTAASPACPMAVDQILHHERRAGALVRQIAILGRTERTEKWPPDARARSIAGGRAGAESAL